MPTIKEMARVTSGRGKGHSPLKTNNKALVERTHKVIQLLGDNGPMRTVTLSNELGYSAPSAVIPFLLNMIKLGKIERTGLFYHLKGQEVSANHQSYVSTKSRSPFDGDSLQAKFMRYLKDHQDQPLSYMDITNAVGYANSSAVSVHINNMIDAGKLRRYRAPEDRFGGWRYQFTDPDWSGVTVTKPATIPEEPTQEPTEQELEKAAYETKSVAHNEEVTRKFLDEQTQLKMVASQSETAHVAQLVAKYGAEYVWQTGDRDIKAFSLWLRERALAEQGGM